MPRPPSSGAVTSPFGMRRHPITGSWKMHYGSDRGGTGNVAPSTGVITYLGYHVFSGFGNTIVIREDATGDHLTVAHHASFAPGLAVGQRIVEGAYTGPIGATGAATGPHTHAERRRGGNGQPLSGVAVDPEPFYTGGGGGGGGGVPIGLGDEDMTYAIRNDFPDQAHLPGVPKDAVFVGNGTDPLVWAGNVGPELLNGVVVASWTAEQIAARINQVGLRGSGKDLNKVFNTMQDAQAGNPVYVLGGSGGQSDPDDDSAVIAAIEQNTLVLSQILAATKALNPPG